jgi:uncharacterized membrane protein YeaQ/YmgE (transglycosylase-associated protein family)
VGIVAWIVVGFVAGAFARVLTGSGSRLGCLGTVAVGIVGGLLGGALFNAAGAGGIGRFGFRSVFVAIIGACALLFVVGLITGDRPGTRRRARRRARRYRRRTG